MGARKAALILIGHKCIATIDLLEKIKVLHCGFTLIWKFLFKLHVKCRLYKYSNFNDDKEENAKYFKASFFNQNL